jgi:CRISPR/Cas system endoribonuclease Cas6 (RAMP superfamily)
MTKNDNRKNWDKNEIQNKFYCWLKGELKRKINWTKGQKNQNNEDKNWNEK